MYDVQISEDEMHYMMEYPACQEVRAGFQNSFDDCEGDKRKLYNTTHVGKAGKRDAFLRGEDTIL